MTFINFNIFAYFPTSIIFTKRFPTGYLIRFRLSTELSDITFTQILWKFAIFGSDTGLNVKF